MVRRVVRDYAFSILFWMPVSQLVAWQMYTGAASEHLHIAFRSMSLLYAVRYFTMALLTPPMFYIVARWPVNVTYFFRRPLAYLLGFVPFAVVFGTIRWCFLPPWIEDIQNWGPRNWSTLVQVIYGTFADVFLVYLGILIAAHASLYFIRSRRQEIERLELLQALSQSELQALKAQLHPHFLFNTLHAISTLIDSDKAAARRMLVKLAMLLRTALKHAGTDLVSLREELEFLESYLDLEKMRLGDRLDVRWGISQATRDAQVPQLILQPIVENAILHGIACCREGGWVEIRSEEADGMLRICVSNSVGGWSQSGLGLGIQNIRARLKHLYSEQATYDFEIQPGGVANATLVLPAFAPVLEVSR